MESKHIFKNLVSGWITVASAFAVAILMLPFIVVTLGREIYGLVALVTVLIGLTTMIDLGLRNALGRELSEARASNSETEYSGIFSSAVLMYSTLALITVLLVMIFAPNISILASVSSVHFSLSVAVIRIYGVSMLCFAFVTPLLNSVLISHGDYTSINYGETISGIVTNILIFVFLKYLDLSIWGWISAHILCRLAYIAYIVVRIRTSCPFFVFSLKNAHVSYMKALLGTGGYIYLIQLAQALSQRADPFLVSYFYGPSGVALYNPAKKITNGIRPIALTLSTQIYPYATKHFISGNTKKLHQILFDGTKYTLLIGLPLSCAMLVYAYPICYHWLWSAFGEDVSIVSNVLTGWVLVDILYYLGGTQWSVLLGMKRLKLITILLVSSSIVNILVSAYLLAFTNYGIPSVIYATVMINLIIRPIVTVHTARVCNVRLWDYLTRSYFRPLASSVLIYLLFMLFRYRIYNGSLLSFILTFISAGLLSLPIIWLLGMNLYDRNTLARLLRNY